MKSELEQIKCKIAEIDAEKNFKLIKEQVEHLVDDTDNLNCLKMWELKKKMGLKRREAPVAKKNEHG